MLKGSVRGVKAGVCACSCVSSTSTVCDLSVECMVWDIHGSELSLICGWMLRSNVLIWGYLQNWEMGASIWAEAPPLELSFWTWVGGTGLWDWPVARYMAWTHKMRSCSSSLAKITVSPSFTALKKARPPSRPVTEKTCRRVDDFCCVVLLHLLSPQVYSVCLTWLRVTVIHSITIQLKEFLWLWLFLSVAAHGKRVLTHLQNKGLNVINTRFRVVRRKTTTLRSLSL